MSFILKDHNSFGNEEKRQSDFLQGVQVKYPIRMLLKCDLISFRFLFCAPVGTDYVRSTQKEWGHYI